MTDIDYRADGIILPLEWKGESIELPLDPAKKYYKKLQRSEYWEYANTLEQLWLQGFVQTCADGGCKLTYEALYSIDRDDRETLGLPSAPAELYVSEKGHLASDEHRLQWECAAQNTRYKNAARIENVVFIGQDCCLLTREQTGLVNEIERSAALRTGEERARNIAKVKKLADKANAKLDKFIQSREFCVIDSVGVDFDTQDDHNIVLKPVLNADETGLPIEPPGRLDPITVQTDSSGRNGYIFAPENACKAYAQISKTRLTGAQVPRFLENPLPFLPPEALIDEDAFSKRVKGVKVKRAQTMPYVAVKPSEDKPGWFDVEADVKLEPASDAQTDESMPSALDDNEFRELVTQAKKTGEPYVYHDGMWIKVGTEQGESYLDVCDKATTASHKRVINAKKLQLVLDIYENLGLLEYDETLRSKLKAEESISYCSVPACFAGKLRNYQMSGFKWLCEQKRAKRGSLLADDMGLGKTIQVIAFLARLLDDDELLPTLIVAPFSILGNWEKEMEIFLPALKNRVYQHIGTKRLKNSDDIAKNTVVLTTYETLSIDQLILGKIHWRLVVSDEAQKIKNFHTIAASAIKAMHAGQRIALTGTPVENRLSELWSIVDFIQPGLLKSYAKFRTEYETPIVNGGEQALSASQSLIERMQPVFCRRLKKDYLDELKPISCCTKEIPMSKEQELKYLSLIDEMRTSHENMALATIQNLIMLCSHPALINKDSEQTNTKKLLEQSPKLRETMEILRKIKQQGEKAIVFTGYKMMQSILRRVIFDELSIDAKIINGDIISGRLDIIDEYSKKPGFNVLILAPKAAGVGLNITAANHVIHYTRQWNPAVESQATDRVYRIGQQNTVHVYFPICSSRTIPVTVEQRLDTLLKEKQRLLENVIIPSDVQILVSDFADIL